MSALAEPTMAVERAPRFIPACLLLVTPGLAALVTAIHGPSLPMMQQHFAGVPGVDYLVPLALTLPMLMITLVAVFVGLLSDRIGRKPLLMWATLLYAVLGTAPLYLDSLGTILASRAALGATVAVLMTVSTTLIADCYSGARRERFMALQVTVAAVSAFLLNALGGGIAERGWRAPYACYAVGLPLALAMAVYLWEPARRASHGGASLQAGERTALDLPKLLGIWGITVLVGVLFLVVPVHLGYLLAAIGVVSPMQMGMAFGINSLGVIAGTVLFGWAIGPRLPVAFQLAVAALVTAAGFIAMQWAHGFGTLTAAGLANGVGCGILLPVLVTWNMRSLPVEKRGVGVGAFQSSMFFGQFVSPLVVVGLQGAIHAERAASVALLGAATAVLGVAALGVGLLRKGR